MAEELSETLGKRLRPGRARRKVGPADFGRKLRRASIASASPEGSSGAAAIGCAPRSRASISRAVNRRRGGGEAARCAWRRMRGRA